MNTENHYQETDLGNISIHLCGEYDPQRAYEYLDAVEFGGGSYICAIEYGKTITGIAPEPTKNTEYWHINSIPGTLTPEYIAMHDRVVNMSEQVGADAEEVRTAEQNVSGMELNVTQMQEHTRQAAESAEQSKDSAAGYAASADASRQAAAESEQNVNAQMTGFDSHVAEKTSEAESDIEAARIAANKAILAQQEQSVNEVTRVGIEAISKAQAAAQTATEKAQAAATSEKNAAASETAAKLSEENATKMAEQVATDKEQVAHDRTAVENAKQEMTGSVAQIDQNTQAISALKGDLDEHDSIIDSLIGGRNRFNPKNAEDGFRVSSTGGKYPDENYFLSDVQVEPNRTFYFNFKTSAYNRVALLNESKETLKIVDSVITDHIMTTADTAYFRFGNPITDKEKVIISDSCILSDIEEFLYKSNVNFIDSDKWLKSKTYWSSADILQSGGADVYHAYPYFYVKKGTYYYKNLSKDFTWFKSVNGTIEKLLTVGTGVVTLESDGWIYISSGSVEGAYFATYNIDRINKAISDTESMIKNENIRMNRLYVSNEYNEQTDGYGVTKFKSLWSANQYIINKKDSSYYNRYTVIVKQGTYTDLQERYSGVVGASYLGIQTLDYVYYESADINRPELCVIEWDGATGMTNPTYADVVNKCPFHIIGYANRGNHTHIKGFTFRCKNLRYCFHVETQSWGIGSDWLVENCIFDWGGCPDVTNNKNNIPVIGMGSSPYEIGHFKNCKLINSQDGNNCGITNHDNIQGSYTDGSGEYKPFVSFGAKITVENCDIGGNDIYFRTHTTGVYGTPNQLNIVGCSNVNKVSLGLFDGATKQTWKVKTETSDITIDETSN